MSCQKAFWTLGVTSTTCDTSCYRRLTAACSTCLRLAVVTYLHLDICLPFPTLHAAPRRRIEMALWPLQLPYGLSHYHRHVQMTGKAVALPYGEHPRWQLLTLQQLLSVPTATSSPSVTHSSTAHQPSTSQTTTKPSKRHREKSRDGDMGVARSVFRRSNTVAATAKKKRKKTPKPQSRSNSGSQDIAKTVEKRKEQASRYKSFGPGTQLGAHVQSPIIIDSDDDSETDTALEDGASLAARYGTFRWP